MDSAIDDEITSINSIYGDDTLVLKDQASSSITCLLRLPSHPSTVLRLEFPPDYPDAPPSITGTETVGDDLPKGAGHRILDVVRDILAQVYRPGEACIYDLLEEAGEALHNSDIFTPPTTNEAQDAEKPLPTITPSVDLGPEPPWILSDPVIEKKSIFIARVAKVSSPTEAQQFLRHLLSTDKKAANATHNINAWRIQGDNGTTYQDCDDDGETAAGGRLLHLMQLMDVWDCMVVVTRWYGGVLLGPDRFRLINVAAREALVRSGIAKEGEAAGKKKGRK